MTAKLTLSVLIVGGVAAIAGIAVSTAQDESRVAQLRAGNVVVQIDPEVGVVDTVFTSSFWATRYLTISPSGELLGLVEIQEGEERDGATVTPQRRQLTVFDWAGDIKSTLADVHLYSWCCDGDTIAAIVGPYHEGGVGFSYRGVVMLDARTGVTRPVPLLEPVSNLSWAEFDSSLYFLPIRAPRRALRFDPRSNQVNQTDFRGISFSPSGRYYLHYEVEGGPEERGWHVIERQSGREIVLPDTSLGSIQGWAFSAGDQLLLARTQIVERQVHGMVASGTSRVIGYTLYDMSRGSVTRVVEGERLPNAATQGDGFTVERNGEFSVIRQGRP